MQTPLGAVEGSPGSLTLRCGRVLDGEGGQTSSPAWVTIGDGRIVATGPGATRPGAVDLGDAVLVPGFLDMQVNGTGAVDFATAPVEEIVHAVDALVARGTTGVLLTICSAPLTLQDCHVWLAHKRDGKSYADIARAEYPQFWDTNKGKRGNQKIISVVRRTVDRVEQYLTHPNRKRRNSEPRQLTDVVLSSFGMVPIYVERRSSAKVKTQLKQKAKRK